MKVAAFKDRANLAVDIACQTPMLEVPNGGVLEAG